MHFIKANRLTNLDGDKSVCIPIFVLYQDELDTELLLLSMYCFHFCNLTWQTKVAFMSKIHYGQFNL